MGNSKIELIELKIEREQEIIANCDIKIKDLEIRLRHEQKSDYKEYISTLLNKKYHTTL